MMYLLIITVLLIGMIWSGLGYGGGALLLAILLVGGGWAALIHWAGGKSQDAGPTQKQNHPSQDFAKSTRPASSFRQAPAVGGSVRTSANGGKWDNSDEVGGLPRAVSPFSDIDDPYDRMILEDEMFREDFKMLSGGNPYDGDSFGGWFGEDD